MSASNIKTFGQLTVGTVVNFYRATTADDTNFVILGHHSCQFGNYTEVLRLDTLEKEEISQNTEIKNFWSIVKEN